MTSMHLDIAFSHPGRSAGDEATRLATLAAARVIAAHGLTAEAAHRRNMQACEDRSEQDEVWKQAEDAALAQLGEHAEHASLVAL